MGKLRLDGFPGEVELGVIAWFFQRNLWISLGGGATSRRSACPLYSSRQPREAALPLRPGLGGADPDYPVARLANLFLAAGYDDGRHALTAKVPSERGALPVPLPGVCHRLQVMPLLRMAPGPQPDAQAA